MPTVELTDEQLAAVQEKLPELKPVVIESMDDLVGQTFVFQCARYIYHGVVHKVTATYIELTKASVVFETGDYTASQPTDKQKVPNNIFVMRQSIEAFYKLNW